MAKVKFPDFIKSASGTISRKRMADGSIRSLVVTKNGTMYETTYRRRTSVSPEEKAWRSKFGTICSAFAAVQKELHLPSDPDTRKKVYSSLGSIYDRLTKTGKVVTPEILASLYAYLEW